MSLLERKPTYTKNHNRNTSSLSYWCHALGIITAIDQLQQKGAELNPDHQEFLTKMSQASQDFVFSHDSHFGVSEKQIKFLLSIYHRMSEDNEAILEKLPLKKEQPQQQQQQPMQPQQQQPMQPQQQQPMQPQQPQQPQQQQQQPLTQSQQTTHNKMEFDDDIPF